MVLCSVLFQSFNLKHISVSHSIASHGLYTLMTVNVLRHVVSLTVSDPVKETDQATLFEMYTCSPFYFQLPLVRSLLHVAQYLMPSLLEYLDHGQSETSCP